MAHFEKKEQYKRALLQVSDNAKSGFVVTPRNEVFRVTRFRRNGMRIAGSEAFGVVFRVLSFLALDVRASTGLGEVFKVTPPTSKFVSLNVSIEDVSKWARACGISITPERASVALDLLLSRFESGQDFGRDALAGCIQEAAQLTEQY